MNSLSQSDESETLDCLPRIKLAPNVLNDSFLVRPRPLNTLHSAICDYRLTLLSTPSGYGKSALLALWLEAILGFAHTDCAMRAAYLSLDAAENDRTHFLLALITALKTLHPACGQRAQTFLTRNSYPEYVDASTMIQILTALIVIDIEKYLPQSFVLVLDNYEQISEPTIHSALNYLLQRLPRRAHVVVSTAQDPPLSLTKLRAYGLATTLRTDTLAFDASESAAFLEKVAGLSLPTAQKLALYSYTEGWPAGLCMLAQELNALPHAAARNRFIESIDNGDEPSLISLTAEAYFREEFFDNLPPSLRTFLMQTSILSILRADVCKAITGCQDSSELLQLIYQRNLFLLRLAPPQNEDETNGASFLQPLFRYHRMFADFLRRRLYHEMADQVSQLHLRAAKASPEEVQKARHYLAAEKFRQALEGFHQNISFVHSSTVTDPLAE